LAAIIVSLYTEINSLPEQMASLIFLASGHITVAVDFLGFDHDSHSFIHSNTCFIFLFSQPATI